MSLEHEILIELNEFDNNKKKLMEHYFNKMKEIQDFHGGQISDIPANRDHVYYQWKDKLHLLGKMK